MQKQSLLISHLIEFAERHHGDGEVVSRRVEGDIHRYTWADVARRSRHVGALRDTREIPAQKIEAQRATFSPIYRKTSPRIFLTPP